MPINNNKFRHGIKYKFCYKCRKLVPGQLYLEHKVFKLNIILKIYPVLPWVALRLDKVQTLALTRRHLHKRLKI
jgi:hypothetical protein